MTQADPTTTSQAAVSKTSNAANTTTVKMSKTKLAMIILGTIVVTIAICYWLFSRYLFPSDLASRPLSNQEQIQLDRKVNYLLGNTSGNDAASDNRNNQRALDNVSNDGSEASNGLQPEAYNEHAGQREIRFSEREINALLSNNSDLGDKLAIDIDNGLLSFVYLQYMDPDVPILGGKNVRISGGLALRQNNGQASVILKGISIMGVPLPSDWLGGWKNKDLVQEFGGADGFWSAFDGGVKQITAVDDELVIELNE